MSDVKNILLTKIQVSEELNKKKKKSTFTKNKEFSND